MSDRMDLSLGRCPGFLQAYLRYMTLSKNRSALTAQTTLYDLREFLQFVHFHRKFDAYPKGEEYRDLGIEAMEISELESVTTEEIERYLCYHDTVSRVKSNTSRKKLCCIRRFFSYICSQQSELGIQMAKNPALNLTVPTTYQAAPHLLSKADVERLLGSIEGESAVRDRAIIMLFLTTGLKLSELAALDLDHYHGSFLTATGNTSRSLYLTSACKEAIDQYLTEYREITDEPCPDNALFISHSRGRRLSTRGIQKAVQKHLNAAGLGSKGYSVQDLRDTAAALILPSLEDVGKPAAASYLGYATAAYAGKRHSPPAMPQETAEKIQNALQYSDLNLIGESSPKEN